MVKTTLYLLRHGQSIANLDDKMIGHTDLDLTELGYLQAERTAEALRDVDFCAIYSSDLVRARNTAKYNAQLHKLDIITDEQLREIYFGDWENVEKTKLAAESSDLYVGGWRENFGTFRCPNGESVVQTADRIYDALLKIAKRHEGKTVLVTFHAAAIRALWGKILDLPPQKWAKETWFPSNASYTIVEYDGNKILPVSFSNDAHLGDLVTRVK